MFSRKTLFKKIYKTHIYAGIFVAIHFVIFSLSGLVLLFESEIQGAPRVIDSGSVATRDSLPHQYYALLLATLQKYPADRPLAMFPNEHSAGTVEIRLGKDGSQRLRGARRVSYDLASSSDQPQAPTASSGLIDWTLRLHRELLLGSNGKIYVGIVGLAYVFMLLSGFFLYGKFMKGRSLGEIRAQQGFRKVDLHKFGGVVTFGWGLVVGISGVFLAFNGWLIKFFQYRSLKTLSQQYESHPTSAADTLTNFAQVIKSALLSKTDAVISYISFPDTEFGIRGHYLVLVNGTGAITGRISELVVVNAHTAKVAQIVELPFYLKMVLLSEPLHFGNYGGIYLKIVWAIFALVSLAVALLGVTSFFRRQKKNRASKTSVAFSPSAQKASLLSSRYLAPTSIALGTWIALCLSLFSTGTPARLALAALLVPISILIFGRRHA